MSSLSPSTSQPFKGLTKYRPGSLREVLVISFPMMMTALSTNLMFFLDRLLLARYSTEAMNTMATTWMACAIFQYGSSGVASIAEVFVGQHNGAKQYDRVAEPVWQMIWFALSLSIVFIPMAIYGNTWFIPEEYESMGAPYFTFLMFFSSLVPLMVAVASFFIGTGRVAIVTFATILANVINLVLAYLFVFGVEGWIPSFGLMGAAYAMVTAQIVQATVLLSIFIGKKKYREKYHTHVMTFNRKVLLKCLEIGLPTTIGHVLEIAAWSVLLNMMAHRGEAYVTIVSIGQSIFILLAFLNDGIQKGIIAIGSNLIGGKQWSIVPKALYSTFQVHLSMMVILALPLLVMPDLLIELFLPEVTIKSHLVELREMTKIALFWVWVFIVFDGFAWVMAGMLTAAGDTKYVMMISTTGVWVFALLPIYIFVVSSSGTPQLTWAITAVYGAIHVILMYIRYRGDRWKQHNITGH
ncbi:MATE family efflux transporter [Candidatus Nucleicultrix amoebiphila]|jgi:MATE family multidrug resistance protein|uniref:Uncharacterized protein n=1 Tax=Candidatus Nucleicultrix amoebiphila FS5 TaxID=1414854 RepID=A0A1W6N3G5_9PROT|nr:MATE family efflux transporter [Candidatus Nucleicultrix amoebiphila]ARN84395.1 hypothetical protein GQ61_02605 [Candidatus Nucleicultrix amoebiphila FS5]